MFAEHRNHLTEVGVVYMVGDDEMQQPTFVPALLEILNHTRAVGGRQRRNPEGGGRILTELARCIEVVRSKWAQSERRARERGLRIGDGRVDGSILGATQFIPTGCCGTIQPIAESTHEHLGRSRPSSRDRSRMLPVVNDTRGENPT